MSVVAQKTMIQPYLAFRGRSEEALEFYRTALGAEIQMMMRFKDAPEACGANVPGDQVMHAAFKIGETVILCSDGGCEEQSTFAGFNLALSLPDGPAVEKAFAALAQGGSVKMPIQKTFWTSHFGMVVDRFGVHWMVMVAA